MPYGLPYHACPAPPVRLRTNVLICSIFYQQVCFESRRVKRDDEILCTNGIEFPPNGPQRQEGATAAGDAPTAVTRRPIRPHSAFRAPRRPIIRVRSSWRWSILNRTGIGKSRNVPTSVYGDQIDGSEHHGTVLPPPRRLNFFYAPVRLFSVGFPENAAASTRRMFPEIKSPHQ